MLHDMQPMDTPRTDFLWAITAYFNPAGYRSRLLNYRRFRRSLNVPLVAVELGYGETFELQQGDAEILIQLPGRDVLWQKERLLNIALEALPTECKNVAWLDCDVIFERDDWARQTSRRLDEVPLVQPFRSSCEAPKDAANRKTIPGAQSAGSEMPGVAYTLSNGTSAQTVLGRFGDRGSGCFAFGLAWAARRHLLDRLGLYDVCVVGGGNRAMVAAAVGQEEHAVEALYMHARAAQHYRTWARPYFASLQACLGNVDGRIWHLWHGEFADRRYLARQGEFHRYGFDPFTDIALNKHGAWQWSSYKPTMHRYVRDYFAARNEDAEQADKKQADEPSRHCRKERSRL